MAGEIGDDEVERVQRTPSSGERTRGERKERRGGSRCFRPGHRQISHARVVPSLPARFPAPGSALFVPAPLLLLLNVYLERERERGGREKRERESEKRDSCWATSQPSPCLSVT